MRKPELDMDKIYENETSNVTKEDVVNHPKHYAKSCGFECIDLMEKSLSPTIVYHYCLGNAFKYIFRHPNKNQDEDLDKAEWYINYASDLIFDVPDDNSDLIWLAGQLQKARERS